MRIFLSGIVFIFLFGLFLPAVSAGVREEYEQARMDYVNAAVCLASYSDRSGQIARYALAEQGWRMSPYKEGTGKVEAKFFAVQNDAGRDGYDSYIIGVTGTENFQDVLLDLNFHKVYFGGQTPGEFIESAAKKNIKSTDPMVHSGFNEYANTAFYKSESGETPYGVLLAEKLKENPEIRIFLTGHSLGGAVATIEAARLLSAGVNPGQLQVVTFGAPAVGNQAFADLYGSRIHLRRITMKGDPVKGLLQGISGEYKQFGEEIVWKQEKNSYRHKHEMALYLDTAMRRFFEAKFAAREQGLAIAEFSIKKDGDRMVYIAPLLTKLEKGIASDERYIRSIVQEVLSATLNAYVFGEGERRTLEEELDQAKAANCEWLLLPEITARKVRTEQNVYYLSTEEKLYHVPSGKFITILQASSGSRDLTPLQVAGHNTLKLTGERNSILKETGR